MGKKLGCISSRPWFRMYTEVLDDPKVQNLPPDIFKAWVNILCLAEKQERRGQLPPLTDIAAALHTSPGEASYIMDELEASGLLDLLADGTMMPHNWNGRQAESASSKRSKRVDVTVGTAQRTLADALYYSLQERNALPTNKGWFMQQVVFAEQILLKSRPLEDWLACIEWAKQESFWRNRLPADLRKWGDVVWPSFAQARKQPTVSVATADQDHVSELAKMIWSDAVAGKRYGGETPGSEPGS